MTAGPGGAETSVYIHLSVLAEAGCLNSPSCGWCAPSRVKLELQAVVRHSVGMLGTQLWSFRRAMFVKLDYWAVSPAPLVNCFFFLKPIVIHFLKNQTRRKLIQKQNFMFSPQFSIPWLPHHPNPIIKHNPKSFYMSIKDQQKGINFTSP